MNILEEIQETIPKMKRSHRGISPKSLKSQLVSKNIKFEAKKEVLRMKPELTEQLKDKTISIPFAASIIGNDKVSEIIREVNNKYTVEVVRDFFKKIDLI